MIRVGVNGYGTIGKRVADAVSLQPDMEVVGVSKTSPDYEAHTAVDRGFSLYATTSERTERFEEAGVPVAGTTADLIEASDVVVDATPAGVGETNRDRYAEYDTPAVFQGGEAAEIAETSFNARTTFENAMGRDAVRVVSCNTTGLCRLLAPLRETYDVERVNATLIRRGGDPAQSDRGPINDVLPDPPEFPSHHAADLETVLPGIDVVTAGITVPATLMHLHAVTVTFDERPTVEAVRGLLADEDRLAVLPDEFGIDGCGDLKEFARDCLRRRGDLPENCVWGNSITVDGSDLYLFQAIHQESVVVPENVDAIRAIVGSTDAATSRRRTDQALRIGRLDSLVVDSADHDEYERDDPRTHYGNSL